MFRISSGKLNTFKSFQNTNLVHNYFNLQQYTCYTTLLNIFRAARCSKHVEECSVTHMLLKIKIIVHLFVILKSLTC